MLKVVEQDSWLAPIEGELEFRRRRYKERLCEIENGFGSLIEYAGLYKFLGFNYDNLLKGWWFREWMPRADEVYLFGDFNGWRRFDTRLNRVDNGVWERFFPDDEYGSLLIHGSRYKILLKSKGECFERLPSCVNRVIQEDTTKVYDAQFWNPESFDWGEDKHVLNDQLLIYECHIGMAQEKLGYGTYKEFEDRILPYIKELGYNALQIMAIAEHPYYGSFGYHVSNFFAPSSKFGTPEELKSLVKRAHELGITVIMDIVHSHFVSNTNEGLNMLDGYEKLYDKGDHPYWGSKTFDYGKEEVQRFLLSNIRYWLEEFHFDGFRFDGVSSMLYYHHGYVSDFGSYDSYFGNDVDRDAVLYLTLANKLIKDINTGLVSIAEDVSGMPTICSPIEDGGIGFDYRLAMSVPDYWIKLLKEYHDEDWNMGRLWQVHVDRLWHTKCVAYCESHDQALVGDKTIAFWLMDAEMYSAMSKFKESLVVDRGIALHKMIRLFTISTGGQAYLNFMGNEFGHPDWIDFPREGNGWSYQYARRQWSLLKDSTLKYEYLYEFDKAMIELVKSNGLLKVGFPELILIHEDDKIIAFRLGEFVFVFNWNVNKSFDGYYIPVVEHGDYEIVLDSDSVRFGGFGRVDDNTVFTTKCSENGLIYIQTYCVNRGVIVYKRKE